MLTVKQLTIEAIFVGLGTVILGVIMKYIVSKYSKSSLPIVCKKWNKNYIMEITLFLIGFTFHVLCEITGVNDWYCKNRVKCK
jgi:hypothetical protein